MKKGDDINAQAYTQGMFWYNLILSLGFLVVVWAEADHSKQLNTPWTQMQPQVNFSWRESLHYDDPMLGDKLFSYAGCSDYIYRDVYDSEFTFHAEGSSSSCVCVSQYVTNFTGKFPPKSQDDMNTAVVRCLVGHRPAMKQVLHDKNGFWVSNPFVLVSLWNIISFSAYLFYNVQTSGFHVKEVLAQLGMLLVSIVGLSVSNPVGQGILAWNCLYVVIFFAACYLVCFSTDKEVTSDWIFWIQVVFVLPLAIFLFNISVQRRDYIFMLSCAFFSTALCVSSAAAGLFMRAWKQIHGVEEHDHKTTMGDFVGNLKKSLGIDYSNIGNYTTLANIALVFFFVQLAYPTLTPVQTLNFQAVSGLGLLILLVAILMRGGSGDHTRVHYMRAAMEMGARTVVSLACLVDVFSIRRI